MAILVQSAAIATALWPQGDIRDPLGVWGFRQGVTGDATGGSVKVIMSESVDQKAAYIYTAYSLLIAMITQATPGSLSGKARLLTGWPNIDEQAGVQAYGSGRTVTIPSPSAFTSPVGVPGENLVSPLDRFLLLFDPRPSGVLADLVELELGDNVLADTYSFEGYGYFWDRSVLNAPGGPRHPGSS